MCEQARLNRAFFFDKKNKEQQSAEKQIKKNGRK